MKNILPILLACVLLLACSKDDSKSTTQNACEAENPLTVSWVKELKDSLENCNCEVSIIKGKYKGQTVFFTAMTDALCNGVDTPILYNCEGKVVRTFTIDDYQEFYSEVSRDEVLYRCKTAQ